MGLAATLSAVASILVGAPTQVICSTPPFGWQGSDGWARPSTNEIWVRRCDLVTRCRRPWTTLLGHEVLHVRYPRMSHQRVYYLDDAMGLRVRRRLGC